MEEAKVKWIPTIFLTMIFFVAIEFIAYNIFTDIFQEWVWWFELPATAPEKANPALNVVVIAKILFGFALLVVAPLGGALIIAEKIIYRDEE